MAPAPKSGGREAESRQSPRLERLCSGWCSTDLRAPHFWAGATGDPLDPLESPSSAAPERRPSDAPVAPERRPSLWDVGMAVLAGGCHRGVGGGGGTEVRGGCPPKLGLTRPHKARVWTNIGATSAAQPKSGVRSPRISARGLKTRLRSWCRFPDPGQVCDSPFVRQGHLSAPPPLSWGPMVELARRRIRPEPRQSRAPEQRPQIEATTEAERL